MSSPYESSFYNVTTLGDLPADKPRVFRAAGATVVLRRDGERVTAIDGSGLADGREMSTREWDDLHSRAGLAVRVEGDQVWVCLDGCKA